MVVVIIDIVGGPGGGFGGPGGGFSDSKSSGKPLLLLRLNKPPPGPRKPPPGPPKPPPRTPPYVENYDPTAIISIFRVLQKRKITKISTKRVSP